MEWLEHRGKPVTASEYKLIQLFENRILKLQKEAENKLKERNLLIRSVNLVSNATSRGPSIFANANAAPTFVVSEAPKPMPVDNHDDESLPMPHTASSASTTTSGNSMPTSRPVKATHPAQSSAAALAAMEDKYEIVSEEVISSIPTPVTAPVPIITPEVSSTTATTASVTTGQPKKIIKRKRDDDDDDAIDMEELIPILPPSVTTQQKSITVDLLQSIPSLHVLFDGMWKSTEHSTPLHLSLNNVTMNNILIISVLIPTESMKWCFNICPMNHLEQENLYFHFSPRYKKGHEIVLNDKQGNWGRPEKTIGALSVDGNDKHTEVLFLVVIRPEGFIILNANKRIVTTFPHRRDISTQGKLLLSFPAVDDNSKHENVIVNKIWWGDSDSIISKSDISPQVSDRMARQSIEKKNYNPIEQTLIVQGFGCVTDGDDIMELSSFFYEWLQHYEIEAVNIVIGKDIAFIRLKSAAGVDDAIQNKNNTKMGTSEADKKVLRLSRFKDLLSSSH